MLDDQCASLPWYWQLVAAAAIFSLYWKCGQKSFHVCSLIAPLLLYSAAGQVICFSVWFKKHGEMDGGGTLTLLLLEGCRKNSLSNLEGICFPRCWSFFLRDIGLVSCVSNWLLGYSDTKESSKSNNTCTQLDISLYSLAISCLQWYGRLQYNGHFGCVSLHVCFQIIRFR